MTLEQTALATLGLAERAVFHMPRTPRPAFGNPARAFERPRTNLGRSQGSTSALVWRRSPPHTPRTLQTHHRGCVGASGASVHHGPHPGGGREANRRIHLACAALRFGHASVPRRWPSTASSTQGAWERSGPFAEGRVGRTPCGTVSLHRLQVSYARTVGVCSSSPQFLRGSALHLRCTHEAYA